MICTVYNYVIFSTPHDIRWGKQEKYRLLGSILKSIKSLMVVAYKFRGQIPLIGWWERKCKMERRRNGGEGRRGRYSTRETSMTSTGNNITDVKLKLLDKHPCSGKDGLTFSPHRPPCQLFCNPTGTPRRCMGMLEPLGMNNSYNLGGKREPAASFPCAHWRGCYVLFRLSALFCVSCFPFFTRSYNKLCGKYRQGWGVWAEELTTFKSPRGWIIAAMKHPLTQTWCRLSRRGGGTRKALRSPHRELTAAADAFKQLHTVFFSSPEEFSV